jgi:hypothetical protein
MEQYLRFLCYGSKEQPLDRGTATREPHIASKARSVVERVKRAKAARATSPLKPAEPVYARFAQPTVEIPPGLPRMRPFHPSAAPLKHADPAELRAQAEGYAAEIRCGLGCAGSVCAVLRPLRVKNLDVECGVGDGCCSSLLPQGCASYLGESHYG